MSARGWLVGDEMTNYDKDRLFTAAARRGWHIAPLRRPPLGKKATRRGKQDTHTYEDQPDTYPAIVSGYNREYWRYGNRA